MTPIEQPPGCDYTFASSGWLLPAAFLTLGTTMRKKLVTNPAVGLVLLLALAGAPAQSLADDQTDVWAIVEAQWDAEENGDRKWIERMLTDDFVGWNTGTPAPRNKASVQLWDRFSDSIGSMVAHELYPLAIVVSGDVAVAHYLYSSAREDKKKGDVEYVNGRYTDVLVRTPDGWKFIAWHGGGDGDAD